MDHVYQCYQDTNNSINVKLRIISGTVTIATIASIISMFVLGQNS